MASKPTISVRLIGPDDESGAVHFSDFRTFCDSMANCLQRSEKVLTGTRGKVKFRVTKLATGSAAMALEAIPSKNDDDHGAEVVCLFTDTVAALQNGGSVDRRLSFTDLKAFRAMIGKLKTTTEVWIEGSKLTTMYIANIDDILAGAVRSKGTVKGFLDTINVHNKRECMLFPIIGGERINCTFPEELFESVRDALSKNVVVSGMVEYQPDRLVPVKVHIEAIEAMPDDDELPSYKDLRGLFRGCTGDKTAVEFVRAIRDEQD